MLVLAQVLPEDVAVLWKSHQEEAVDVKSEVKGLNFKRRSIKGVGETKQTKPVNPTAGKEKAHVAYCYQVAIILLLGCSFSSW